MLLIRSSWARKKHAVARGKRLWSYLQEERVFRSRTSPRRSRGSMMQGQGHVRHPGKQALASVPPHRTTTARPDLRASGSGRRPHRRMARLQIIPGSSQRLDPSAALSSSDRSRLAALNVMLLPVLSLDSAEYCRGFRGAGGAGEVQGI